MHGEKGVGLIFAEKMDSIVSILESFWEVGKNILLQELVPESRDRDIRAFVVGGQVLTAMRRIAPVGEFREALDRAAPVVLEADAREAVLRTAAILGLEVATVDLIETNRGPLVTDIGWSPGLEIVESVTQVDVAAAILEHAETLAQRRRRAVPGLARSTTTTAFR
jgi:ribosomal protein S6--L-glutamate ligase